MYMYSLCLVGCSFLSVTTIYTQCGSGFVVPSAAAKAGLEIMTRYEICVLLTISVFISCYQFYMVCVWSFFPK